jgi:deoxyribonuclease V
MAGRRRGVDEMLRGVAVTGSRPRRARDVVAQSIVEGPTPAAYEPGYLALREGPLLAAAVDALAVQPDVLFVDATGLDHPRRAGLAVHIGAVCAVPTIGVTHRSLVAVGRMPALERGMTSPMTLVDEVVAMWVCTRTGARPVVAHAAWRTSAVTAAELVLRASSESSRTPVPLQEARRVAREARALSEK